MTVLRAGDHIDYTITYLEMTARPAYARPHLPADKPMALMHVEDPPPWYFLSLYDAVGADHEWTDWRSPPADELTAYICNAQMKLYTLLRTGWPAGFFLLDGRKKGICDLAYFGLVPEALGFGLGRYLLGTAIHMGWDTPGVGKLTVNTCTLDHPRALPLYQKAGFEAVDQREASRVLTRDRIIERKRDA